MSRIYNSDHYLLMQHFPGLGHRASARFGARQYGCSIGSAGVRQLKREGDLASPAGIWPMRYLLYRADRIAKPRTGLPARPIRPDDGWCDDPQCKHYNSPVSLPIAASHEELWRKDNLYDLVVVLGHNDAPAIPGRGSAVFIHLMRPDRGPTHGCIAFDKTALLSILENCSAGTRVIIPPPA